MPLLMTLKLRYDDFGDVIELIRANELGEECAAGLGPNGRRSFWECSENWKRVPDDMMTN